MLKIAIQMMEKGLVPDVCVRWGIRRLLKQRLTALHAAGESGQTRFLDSLRQGPIAHETEPDNWPHAEVPAEFFSLVLGKHMKYSAGLWTESVNYLDQAESAMLALTCERAELADGQRILELGCGWGALTLWMAEHYPHATIVAMSNSQVQGEFIQAELERRGLVNLRVVTADINQFAPDPGFDRIVSVEMFEHMHNFPALFDRLASWLKSDGKAFLQICSHGRYAYPLATEGEDDWLTRHFFSGGLMPSHGLFARLQTRMKIVDSWRINGAHYRKTCEAWLQNQDFHRREIMAVFDEVYGRDAARWFQRWRLYFMVCAELFGYQQGEEWGISHYVLEPTQRS